MPGKSLEYWRKKYDSSTYHRKAYNVEGLLVTIVSDEADKMWKTMDLLLEYVASHRHISFFTCRYYVSHSNKVRDAIANFSRHIMLMSTSLGLSALVEELQTVKLLSLVKRSMEGNELGFNGDFTRILRVVKEKTGVDYLKLNVGVAHKEMVRSIS